MDFLYHKGQYVNRSRGKVMKKSHYQLIILIFAMISFIQSSHKVYSQESLSADTPFIQVNGK